MRKRLFAFIKSLPYLCTVFRLPLHRICLSRLTQDGRKTRARRRQKRIESRLTRDLFVRKGTIVTIKPKPLTPPTARSAFPLGTQTSETFVDRRVEAWGAPFIGSPQISICGESGGNSALYVAGRHLLALFAERERPIAEHEWQK